MQLKCSDLGEVDVLYKLQIAKKDENNYYLYLKTGLAARERGFITSECHNNIERCRCARDEPAEQESER